MKQLLLLPLLLLLVACGTEPEVTEYRANVYIESYTTVQRATIAELKVIESNHSLPNTVWAEFAPYLQEAFYLNYNARTRFGVTGFVDDTLFVVESVGSEFQNLYR